MTSEKFAGWIASLSDGSEVYETEPIPGEKTPWQKLIDYTKETGVRVTMLRLARGGITVSTMPTKTAMGYFQGYDITMSLFAQEVKRRQGIGSVVGDKVFITWVNDFGNVWQDIRDLSDCVMHTTLRE